MGFMTFLMPERFGALAGLPVSIPILYSGFIATNILLFAFVGLWQARQAVVNSAVLVIFGLSKIIFCGLMFLSWQIGDVALPGFLMSGVDFAMGFIFLLGAHKASQGEFKFTEKGS